MRRAPSRPNHPNVCTLYDIGPNYLVMELIDGETLSAHIGKGPLPIDEGDPSAPWTLGSGSSPIVGEIDVPESAHAQQR